MIMARIPDQLRSRINKTLPQVAKMKKHVLATLSQARVRRGAVVVLVLVLTFGLWFYQATKDVALARTPWYKLPAPCRQPSSTLTNLASLALLMHETLLELQAPHALCYGTLWGALRQGRTLAWDNNVDMCAMDVHLRHVDTETLLQTFQNKGGYWVAYDWRTGTYNFTYRQALGQLHVFSASSLQGDEVAVPGGWSRMLWRWMGQSQLTFPLWLLQAPFNSEIFHNRDFPVPHDGMELLKYQYPDDWWLEVKPAGCA